MTDLFFKCTCTIKIYINTFEKLNTCKTKCYYNKRSDKINGLLKENYFWSSAPHKKKLDSFQCVQEIIEIIAMNDP